MFDLTGKTALVTGASRGIGRAIALALAARGADVALHFNAREDAARAVAAEVEAMGRRAMVLGADARDFAAFSEVWARAETALGPLDILVNNAGLLKPAFLGLMSEATWDETLDVNLKAAFGLSKKAARAMFGRKRGRIINVASQAGQTGEAMERALQRRQSRFDRADQSRRARTRARWCDLQRHRARLCRDRYDGGR